MSSIAPDRRIAIVSGARQGIGAAVARRLASDGAWVFVNDREEGRDLTAVAEEVRGCTLAADVTDRERVTEAVAEVERVAGGLDVLVCNHAYMTMDAFTEHDEDDWWRIVDTNLTGTFTLIQAALPAMRRRGGGRIVVIASEWGVTGWPRATAYAASKAGLISLVKTLGRELARENIVVNAVAPGVTDTPQLQVDAADAGIALAEMHARYGADIPVGRIGTPEEIAAAVAFLARPQLGAFVGQTLQINGGSTRCRV